VALAATFIIAVGATTMRYTTVVKEMNVLFNGQLMVVSSGAVVIQAIPIGGSMLPQNFTEERIRDVAGVANTVPILFVTPMQIDEGLQAVPVNFSLGIPVADWQLILGSTPLKDGVGHFPTDDSSSEIVLGNSLAGQYNWTVGKTVNLNGFELNVTGILDTKMALLSRSVVMPLRLAQQVYNYWESVNMFTVSPAQGYLQQQVAEAVEQHLGYVKVLTEDERNDIIQPVLAQVEIWNLGIQTVVFLLSLILVMTITVMSVSERRRDFATLDAIGAPLTYVFRVVIFETALIGVIGGVLGVFFGSLGALFLGSLYTNIPISQFFSSVFEIVPPLYMLEIFAVIILVCCAGGIVPALNAARMRLAEVLKAEY
jgi:ABC-type lipoprotein release transport system permease subunit